MSTPQSPSGSVSLAVNIVNALSGGGGGAADPVNVAATMLVKPGTGAGQATDVYSAVLNLTASTPVILDTTNLTGAGGRAITFTAVKGYVFVNADPIHPVTLGGGANPFAPWLSDQTVTEVVGAGGGALAANGVVSGAWTARVCPTAAGWPVTGGSHQNIKIDPGANNVGPVQIVVWGLV